jgi:hypothetical protein
MDIEALQPESNNRITLHYVTLHRLLKSTFWPAKIGLSILGNVHDQEELMGDSDVLGGGVGVNQ